MRRNLLTTAAAAAALTWTAPAAAQDAAPPATPDPNDASPYGYPISDKRPYVHGLLDEFEGRLGADKGFRWEGEGWVGGRLQPALGQVRG